MAALVERAEQADSPAVREVLERAPGRSEALDVLARVERLEERLAQATEEGASGWT